MKAAGKFLALVVLLNLVRYTVPLPVEQALVFSGLSRAMMRSQLYFNTEFTAEDWITSYF